MIFDIWSDWRGSTKWWGMSEGDNFEEACRELAANDYEFRRMFNPLRMTVAGYKLRFDSQP